MFPFKKPPSRAEVARETVVNAVSDAFDSFTHHAHDWLESAHDKLELAGEKIEHTVENSPLDKAKDKAKSAAGQVAASGVATVAGAAEKLGVLGAGAATGAALAGKSVAEKVSESLASVREPAPQNVPDIKRARKQAQTEIKNMNKQAANYKRELEKELARDHELFAAEQTRLQQEHEQLQVELADARREADEERAALSKRQRKTDEKNDIVRVPIAPTDEVVGFDDDYDGDDGDYEYRDAENRSSGGNTWLILGGLLLAGAGAAYYLFSSTDGKRKKAAIQDRVGQVAEGVREKVTQNSDATGETDVAKVAEAAIEAFDRSNEKIADEATVAGIDAKLPPTSAEFAGATKTSESASDKIEEVSDKLADGIAGAGAFLAGKLEAAGAGAKSAAHSAADRLDEVKDKAAAKMDEARKPAPTQAPNAVVVEVITDEPPKGQTTDEILAEVEETVRNIENSANEGKK